MGAVGRRADIAPGDVLDGKYRILRPIGAGGMGAVFAAKRLALDDTVAIKCILPAQDTQANRARFLREAKAAARIRHPNVVQVFDFGESPDLPPYMVMEYLKGPALSDALRRGRLPLARALQIFADVCAAVEAGHRRGVVHRDLKPANVILAISDDGRETVKVLDFGLARLTDSSSLALTQPGALLGTCAYMAPEQIEGGDGGPASDVFSLGVMLYELATGELPFQGATQIAAMLKIAEGRFRDPKEVVPDLPAAICEAIAATLKTDTTARPASPEALAALAGVPLSPARAPLDYEPDGGIEGGEVEADPTELTQAGASPLRDEETIVQEGATPEAFSRAPSSAITQTPFVGRRGELESLEQEYRAALQGGGRITVVTGDAGVGKTRLLEQFLARAQREGAAVLRGRFFSYEGDRPPPHETYLWMLAGREADQSDVARNGPGPGPNLGDDKWQAFGTIAHSFAARAGARPLVIALDDLHWATALDLEFLSYLQRGVNKPDVLVVATARAAAARADAGTDLSRWLVKVGNQRALTRIGLQPFDRTEIRDWLGTNFRALRIRPEDVRRLAKVSGGNPYYLAEVVRHLVATGVLTRSDDGWICTSLERVELPETVNTVMRAKIQDLDEALRETLQLASVVGEEFRFETLQAASQVDEDELEALLERAVNVGLLSEKGVSPGADFRFDSSTLRSVLYGDLSVRKRKRLHRKVVDALERLYAKDRERIAKVLCYHFHAIGDWEPTLHWGLVAGGTLTRDDIDNAEACLGRAREAAQRLHDEGMDPPVLDLAQLEYLSGELYGRLGRLQEADALLRKAADRAAEVGDRKLQTNVLVALGETQLGVGDLEAARRTGESAIELARRLGETELEFVARANTASYSAQMGDHARARDLLEPVVGAEDDPRLARVRSQGFRELAWIDTRGGVFKQAEAHAQRARELAVAAGDALLEYRAIATLAVVYGESGAFEPSTELMRQALEMARSMSLRRREGIELLNLGENYYMMGRYEDALSHTLEALAIFSEIKDRATEGGARVNLGRILLAKGDHEAALPMLQRGRELCEATGRPEYAGLALLDMGEANLAADRPEAAREAFAAARELFTPLSSLYLWRAELGLGRSAKAVGDAALARTHAEEAARLIERQRGTLTQTVASSGFHDQVSQVRRFLSDLQASDG
jgi:serine/threonine protein kinase/tetratricopeptide (TPR) repeat protein